MRGHIYQLPSCCWRIKVYMGKDEQGKKVYHSTTKPTSNEAEDELARIINETNQGTFVRPSKLTLAEFLITWLADYGKPNLKPTSYDMYESLIRVHIKPGLGYVRLDRLSPLAIQRFLNEKRATKRQRNGEGNLSLSTVGHIYDILNISLNTAVQWNCLAKNPAAAVGRPGASKTKRKKKTSKRTVWTAKQLGTFLEATKNDRYYAAYLLAVTTGMRRGEILGLRWRDIDLSGAVIEINQTVVKTREERALVQDSAKTDESERPLAISYNMAEAFRARVGATAQERFVHEKIYGKGSYQDNDLIYPALDGSPLKPDSFTQHFKRLVRRINAGLKAANKDELPQIRFQDLRHTNATMMLKAGVPLKIMSQRLGHSNIQTTANVYSHVLEEMDRDVADTVERVIRDGRKAARRENDEKLLH